jgi:hypothetical protein
MRYCSAGTCATSIALLIALNATQPTAAMTMQECSAKYKAAQSASTLGGMTWQQFRKANCGPNAPAAAPAVSTPPAASQAGPSFPQSIAPKYANEPAGKARMHTCLDQYRANKLTNSNGGLRWIKKGGGYYSECNKRLKG